MNSKNRIRNPLCGCCVVGVSLILFWHGAAQAEGEPAEEFLKRLRAANYFDTAISYLDRIDQYPGVDPQFKKAIDLEKAQTYIDAAVAARNATTRDDFFLKAETSLNTFIKAGTHPRQAEARMQLGKLQMVRAAQLMSGTVDDAKRSSARESYLAAAKTFDAIVDSLREKLKSMQGAKVDAKKNPEQAALRDQYRGEFLESLMNSGQARLEAAKTYPEPAKGGKKLLEEALVRFTDLSEKYDSFVQGAAAMLYRGLVQEDLGKTKEARDAYVRMLEAPDADPLRDVKFQATSGMIRLLMAEKPAKFQAAIDQGQPMLDTARPNEKRSASMSRLQIDLAKAYLAKSKDTAQKPADAKRADTEGRQLLIKVSKIAGDHVEESTKMLSEMGIDAATAEAPTLAVTEDPISLEDAISKSRDLLQAGDTLAQSLAALEKQSGGDAEKKELQTQLVQARASAIHILRHGLALINGKSDVELTNQARQYLAYVLYQGARYREAGVVGSFLAQAAPKTDVGLKGGLLALNSLQMVLVEETDNIALARQLEQLGGYLSNTWPDSPDAASAQSVMIKLALRNDQWDNARALINDMPVGADQASFRRLLGQLLWNQSIQSRAGDDAASADKYLREAEIELRQGLDGIQGKLAGEEAMRAALVLVKIYLRMDEGKKALGVFDHEVYGPKKLYEKLDTPDQKFGSELYSTELQLVVAEMAEPNANSDALMKRAGETMDKLRESVTGDDAQGKLTAIYMRMARDIRDQLETANPIQKTKLIQAFRVFLERISKTSDDPATLQWIGQTMMQLAESSMQPTDTKAVGQAAELLNTAVGTFESLLKTSKDAPLTVKFQLGKAYRMLGKYKNSVDTFQALLAEKPMMLDAQMEAATAYEQWAATLSPKITGNAYKTALNGGRPGADKKNIIWGWGMISQLTSRDPKHRAIFFESRYHVALCRFLWGKAVSEDKLIRTSVTDITKVAALYPELGGPAQRKKFDQLLKQIQKQLGEKPDGLPQLQPQGN